MPMVILVAGEDKITLFENTLPYLGERFCVGQRKISPLYRGKHAKKKRTPTFTNTPPISGGILRRVTQNPSSVIGNILREGTQNLSPSKKERFCVGCVKFFPFIRGA